MDQEFQPTSPIYLQLAERIIRSIIRGERQPGEKLPSVREMAVQSGVNPNTIQRTYSELERQLVVETRRGQGTFVTENQEILSDMRESLKIEHLESFIHEMELLGFTFEEMISGLKEVVAKRKGEKNND